jgi:alcohol dehydrogenase class IV
MFGFQYYVPTKIVFGIGNVEKTGKEVAEIGKRVLVVTGSKSAEESGTLKKVVTNIEKEGIGVKVFKGVTTNPSVEIIEKGTNIASTFKPDAILTIGGGSVHDVGKAISFMATHDGELCDYALMGKKGIPGIKNKTIPLITVPTISGTGAEISPAALVRIENKKEIVVSPYLFPKASIVDPALLVSAPPKVSAQVGIDGFIQGLEAFVSKNAQPFSDVFALEAMKRSIAYLPDVVKNPDDLEARSFIALSAIESVFAIAQAGVGAIHALSDPLSGYYNIHHGLALSILAPEVMEANLDSNTKRFAKVAELFGIDTTKISVKDAAQESISCVKSFLHDVGLSPLPKLREFGVTLEEVDRLVQDAKNPDMFTNPKEMTDEEIMSIYKKLI